MQYPPNNYKELIRLLKRLGFVQVSAGNHNYKFTHPERKPNPLVQRPFITISTGRGRAYSLVVIREIKKFGFTNQEIQDAC